MRPLLHDYEKSISYISLLEKAKRKTAESSRFVLLDCKNFGEAGYVEYLADYLVYAGNLH